jgi:Uma2 family endonuclease
MITITAPEKILVESPQRRQMSYEEYLKFAPDSRIVEWVDGEVIIYMPPVERHQDVCRFLGTLLDLFTHFLKLGRLIYAPFEVKLWPGGPSREPDIVFIVNENIAKLTPERFEGSPDLLIEIISPGSVTEDRVRKFTEYERAGVREYWIIDPRPHQQQADFYLLGEDKIFHPAPLAEDGVYHSTVIPGFWLNVDWLWLEALPDPQMIFAEIIASAGELPDEIKAAYQTIQAWLADKNKK